MKFTFAPAGPSTGSDRSSLPRLTTSTSSTSSTRTTRCGTPTVPRAACRSPGAMARPGTGVGEPTGARCNSARSPSGVQPLVRGGVGLERHALRLGQPQSGGKTCAAQGGVAAHGRARTVRVEVDHPDDVRPVWSRSRPDEHEAVGADAGAPRAHRPDVLDGPVSGARVAAVDHDEVIPRPRHLVDRGPD